MEGKPSDRQIGRHKFKGLRHDRNGNPIYTHPSKLEDLDCGTLSDDDLRGSGVKYSKKHGLNGQISDPTKITESNDLSVGDDAQSMANNWLIKQ